ncbi:MAG TPA: MFS transporter [Solirubrobacteraceae bacterium]|nr:MFS transporter [Solirubrobacteraceae bacterium]
MGQYTRVLRHPNFRFMFAGQAASAIGDGVVLVAIALYVTDTTGSVGDLGLVLGAQALAMVTLLLIGGVWADRLPRQRVMIATDLVRATLHAVLAVLILTGGATVVELVVIEACYGAAEAFFRPAYSGLVPQTVPEDQILDARALTEWTANLATLVGPALATALVLGVGAGEAFAFDSATFVFSALMLARVHPRPRGLQARSESLLRELGGGFREVRSRTWVWVTIAAYSGAVLCMYAQWYALAPGIARDHYGGAGVFGVIETVAGIGAVFGALASLRWRPTHPLRTGLLLTLAWPLQLAVFALGAPLALVIPCGFATGWGFSLMLIWWETALARHIPAHMLSRVSAYDWMGSLALLPLGYVLAGPLAEALGAQTVLGVGSVIGLAVLLLALVPRSTRELTERPATPEELRAEPRLAHLPGHPETWSPAG